MQIPGSIKQRIAIAALTLSAGAFVGLTSQEGYTDEAVIPVKGDVPTYGFGMTRRPDGSPVQMGDKTTPAKALRMSLAHIKGDEVELKKCVTADLHQAEYDLLVDHAYQYGPRTTCRSSIVASANAGNYAASCAAYKEFRLVRAAPGERRGPGMVIGGDGVMRYDCSTMVEGPDGALVRNKRCWGVWQRSKDRYDACMAAQ